MEVLQHADVIRCGRRGMQTGHDVEVEAGHGGITTCRPNMVESEESVARR